MTDLKIKILIFAAAVLLVLSAVIPLAAAFAPAADLVPPQAAVADEPSADIAAAEEMRALWIATVNNINFPSKKGLSREKLAAELDGIVDFAAENGFNAIMFQVRPTADALYDSNLFPASKFVSGECGKAADDGFDCLGYLLEAAHAKSIAVHAWVNPLRVTSGNTTYPQTDIAALPESSPARQHEECVVAYADGKLYFDAGQPYVRSLVAAGVKEICEKYDVDGIIFDDYFYPYPSDGAAFDDAATYAEYGDGMTLADFRRDSVNQLVKLCYETVKSVDETVQFGVSPFGIWQNSDGKNGGSATRGLEAYDSIYCDALAWARGGYVDYLAPQIYWSFDTKAAPFDTLAEWWNEALRGTGVKYYISYGVYRYADGAMESGEVSRQVEFARGLDNCRGGMYYGYAALKANSDGVTDELAEAFEKSVIYLEVN
ncbi:MAG: family 10 glycosylhydrolase [Clostridia bacterium]|nr:family 10 glycosylhydrolase [Clostridia bacterium]